MFSSWNLPSANIGNKNEDNCRLKQMNGWSGFPLEINDDEYEWFGFDKKKKK